MSRFCPPWLVTLSLVLGLSCLLSTPVHAGSVPWHDGNQPCWDAAGARHGVDPWLLYAIAKVESSYNPKVVSRPNRNGTRDVGLMQINSTWLPTLRANGVPNAALFNACASTYIGSWIMAKNFRRYGYSWKAIAAYNVGSVDTPKRYAIGMAYAKKVYAAYAHLTRSRPSALPQTSLAQLP